MATILVIKKYWKCCSFGENTGKTTLDEMEKQTQVNTSSLHIRLLSNCHEGPFSGVDTCAALLWKSFYFFFSFFFYRPQHRGERGSLFWREGEGSSAIGSLTSDGVAKLFRSRKDANGGGK